VRSGYNASSSRSVQKRLGNFVLVASGAAHVALVGEILERRRSVRDAAIVPNHDVTDRPAVATTELALGREFAELRNLSRTPELRW